MVLSWFWLRNLAKLATAVLLVVVPPKVVLTRRTVHTALDYPEVWRSFFANTIAMPHMRPVDVHFVMEGMMDCDTISTMRVDGIRNKKEFVFKPGMTAFTRKSRKSSVGISNGD